MAVTDSIKQFSCPTCGGPAEANVRRISAWGGQVSAVSQQTCITAGHDISKRAAEEALRVCPTCQHDLRERVAREQAVAGPQNRVLYCDTCQAEKVALN